MSVNLHFKDLYEFTMLPPRSSINTAYQNHQRSIRMADGKAGEIQFTSTDLLQLQLLHMNWRTSSDQLILQGNEHQARTIGISFQTGGFMHTRFNGVKSPLDMQAGRNNLVYYPEPGDRHIFGANQLISALQINLDIDFFKACIGSDDPWSARILKRLDNREPFSAVENSALTTPHMQQLINSIINCEVTGPMRNMLIQARVYELLALQLAHFKSLEAIVPAVSINDSDQLHALKAYLDAHFLDDLNLNRLSRVFFINEFKLKKGFKLLFGDTVFGYIRKLRMDYAALLLKDHNKTVDEVALVLNYENSNHFSTAFKKYFGYPPSMIKAKG